MIRTEKEEKVFVPNPALTGRVGQVKDVAVSPVTLGNHQDYVDSQEVKVKIDSCQSDTGTGLQKEFPRKAQLGAIDTIEWR